MKLFKITVLVLGMASATGAAWADDACTNEKANLETADTNQKNAEAAFDACYNQTTSIEETKKVGSSTTKSTTTQRKCDRGSTEDIAKITAEQNYQKAKKKYDDCVATESKKTAEADQKKAAADKAKQEAKDASLKQKKGECGYSDQYKGGNSACSDAVNQTSSAENMGQMTALAGAAVGVVGRAQVAKTDGSLASSAKAQETTLKVGAVASFATAAIAMQKAMALKNAAKQAEAEGNSFQQISASIDSAHCDGSSKDAATYEQCVRNAAANAINDKENPDIEKAVALYISKRNGSGASSASAYYGSLTDAEQQSLAAAKKAKTTATSLQAQAMMGAMGGITSMMAARQAGKIVNSAVSGTGASWSPTYSGGSMVPGMDPNASDNTQPFGGNYAAAPGDTTGLGSSGANGVGGGLANSGSFGGGASYNPAKLSGAGGGGGMGGLSGGGSSGASRAPAANTRRTGPTGVGGMVGGPGGTLGSGGTKKNNAVGEDMSKVFCSLMGTCEEKKDDKKADEGTRELASIGGSGESGISPIDVNIFEQITARYQAIKQGGRL